ncbi:MAG: alginate lyase family protein, partial [Planctomycetota bacterium]
MECPLICGSEHWAALHRSATANDPSAAATLARIRDWSEPVSASAPVITILDRLEWGHHRPTQDPQAYVSWGTYFWLNPDTATGTPLIHRDGRVSPEVLRYDRPTTEQAFTEMIWLASRGYLLNDEPAMQRLEAMLLAWFVDDTTAMRPHLQHAQIVPGTEEAEGRPVGTIDFNFHIPRLLEVLSLVWDRLSPRCRAGVSDWFVAFL